MKKSTKILSLITALSISVSAASAKQGDILTQKDFEQVKKENKKLFSQPGMKIIKGIDQGDFKQYEVEASGPRGVQRFQFFQSNKIKDTIFFGAAFKTDGTQYSLPVNEKVINEGVAFSMGTGSEQLYLVTDPECPYCQKLEEAIKPEALKKYTINVIPLPLSFHKKAKPMLYWVLSGKTKAEQSTRMHKVMTGDKEWETFKVSDTEKSRIDSILSKSDKASKELGAQGTPSVFDKNFQKTNYQMLVQ